LAFIPYFGSMIALVIGALVAVPRGVATAALAALAIGAGSFVEGYLITPFLQSRPLSVPAVELLFFMLVFAVLATVVMSLAYQVFVCPTVS
jgi:predicted PurR-regulated permease PerM